MATLTQLRTRVDAWLADKWPTMVARQENYRTNRGMYWQGLITHTVVPSHTNAADGDSIADQLSVHPHDQFADWISVFPEWDGLPIPCALEVSVYEGPTGVGWWATLYVRYNGILYARSQNVGPQSNLTQPWHVVNENPPFP